MNPETLVQKQLDAYNARNIDALMSGLCAGRAAI